MANTTATVDESSAPWRSCFRPGMFQGKVGLVTGGGTGIGRAIATEMALLGATVVIASRDAAKCQAAAEEMNRFLAKSATSEGGSVGQVVVGPATNIKKEEDVENLISHIVSTYHKLNFVVNNGGGQFVSPTEEMSARGFQAVVDTNLVGSFLVTREAYRQYMMDHGGGAIVNITIGNRNGMPLLAHSAAARAGVENLAATLSSEWMASGVRINNVRPGIIYTDSGFVNYGDAGPEYLQQVVQGLPSRRLGSAQEVASAVIWLLSDGASYVTGATVCVDGGASYHAFPLLEIPLDAGHFLPVYGDLPPQAKL